MGIYLNLYYGKETPQDSNEKIKKEIGHTFEISMFQAAFNFGLRVSFSHIKNAEIKQDSHFIFIKDYLQDGHFYYDGLYYSDMYISGNPDSIVKPFDLLKAKKS